MGGYNTICCGREIPGTEGKGCRMIGAHEKEKNGNRSNGARKKYFKTYNRLKVRTQRGTISTEK